MIHLVCALKCEARPLVGRFQLEADKSAALFQSFCNTASGISLTICGIGKLAACAGTMHAAKHFNAGKDDIWLNIGIAGHRSLPLGQLVLASSIEDAASGVVWKPVLGFDNGLPEAGLITLEKASEDYGDAMYDMEAAGFVSAARRCGSKELIHCLKIISDNPESPTCRINKSQVCRLIESQTDVIESFISRLQAHFRAA